MVPHKCVVGPQSLKTPVKKETTNVWGKLRGIPLSGWVVRVPRGVESRREIPEPDVVDTGVVADSLV